MAVHTDYCLWGPAVKPAPEKPNPAPAQEPKRIKNHNKEIESVNRDPETLDPTDDEVHFQSNQGDTR